MPLPRVFGPEVPGSLRALAVLAVPLLLAGLGHLALGIYGPAFADPSARVADFSYYHDAAATFAADPDALYQEALARPGTGFAYPPPAIVSFLPLTLLPMPGALLVMGVATALLAAASVRLTLRLYETGTGEVLPAGLKRALLLVGLATAPVLQNLRFGQVNVLVLALGLLFLHLLARDRPTAAAVVLALGFWLKLYPLALALLGIRRGRAARLAGGFALGLVGVPLLLAPLVPLDLYARYALDVLPVQAGTTQPDALNQALPAVAERLRRPPEVFFQLDPVPLQPVVKGLTAVAVAAFLGGLSLAYLSGRLRREVAGVGMLAALPVVSVLGWEHTYVLALPLVFVAVLLARHRGRVARCAVAAAVLVLMLPKPPRGVMERLLEQTPRGLSDLLYARFPLAVLLLLALVVAWTWRQGGRTPTNAGAPGGACAGEPASLR